MTRREAALSALLVLVVALALRAVFAAQIVFPKPEDTAYYVGVARNLAEGRGLVSDALWSYGTPPLVFPRPAFEVWLPLPSLLAVLPMMVLGTTFAAAQLTSVLIGAVVPVLAWRLALDVANERGLSLDRSRWIALGTGLTSAAYLPLVLNSALPDSTMLFAAIVLGATLLMTRIARTPGAGAVLDPRLIGLGVLLGLGALTRNETVWLALVWAGMAWFAVHGDRALRIRLIGVVAGVAFIVFVPWAVRNLAEFGSPLPGQAISNALFVDGHDVFAWNDPPTLERHLALGLGGLVELRLAGLGHNLVNVLVLLGLPMSIVGLAALPWQVRDRALRPLVVFGLITFLVTSLLFPAATQWGTFLHAAGPVHVLLVLAAVLGSEAAIDRLGRRLGWTRSVAWVPALGATAASLLFTLVLLPSFGEGSRSTAATYEELGRRMAAVGEPLDAASGPVITNFPIWLAETYRVPSLALPNEPPSDVVHLADAFPGTRLLVLIDPENDHWPNDLAAGTPGAACFHPIDLGRYAGPGTDPLADTTVYEIGCP